LFHICIFLDDTFIPQNETSGKLFSNMEERPVEGSAQDRGLAKKLFLIDEYWTGLKSKDEIKTAS
jgi:hypothetical protein